MKKMKNYELKAMTETVVALFKKKANPKQVADYTYFVTKNARTLVEEFKIIEGMKQLEEPDEQKFALYNSKRKQLLEKYADRDDNGNVKKIENGEMTQYFLEVNGAIVEEEGKKLDEEFKEVIEKKNDAIKSYNEFMQKDADATVVNNLVRISKSAFPEGFDQKDLMVLLDLIDG